MTSHADITAPYAAALRMVRDAIGELFGPAADLESEEAVLLRGPEPHHEAEAIIAALQRLAAIKPLVLRRVEHPPFDLSELLEGQEREEEFPMSPVAERSAPSGEAVQALNDVEACLDDAVSWLVALAGGDTTLSNGISAVRHQIDDARLYAKTLAALASPPAGAVPSDMVMVPREPTEAMRAAAYKCWTDAGFSFKRMWDAMLAAAPTPPPVQPVPADVVRDLRLSIELGENALRGQGQYHILEAAIRSLVASAEATLASLAAKETGGWQSMDSAPKDGTRIDLWVRPWDAEANGNPARITDAWFEGGKWKRVLAGCTHNIEACGEPSHWTPIPATPETDGRAALAEGGKQ